MDIILLTTQNLPQVGNILYKIRDKLEIPQKHVAEIMHKRQSMVSGMENNRKAPGLINMAKYLEAMKGQCQLAILMYEPEEGLESSTANQ